MHDAERQSDKVQSVLIHVLQVRYCMLRYKYSVHAEAETPQVVVSILRYLGVGSPAEAEVS